MRDRDMPRARVERGDDGSQNMTQGPNNGWYVAVTDPIMFYCIFYFRFLELAMMFSADIT